MERVAIVGAGLLGRLLALLLKGECKVSLFEKDSLSEVGSTGRLAAAMVAPVAESVVASPHIVEMGRVSGQMWPELLMQLGLPDLYQQNGTLVVAHRQDGAELEHFQRRLKSLPDKSVVRVSGEQLSSLEPELDLQFSSGLFLPQEGHIDNHQLYESSEVKLRASNVELFEHANVQIHELLDKFDKFDKVVDCRGLGARGELSANSARLRGVRGEVVRLFAPEVNLSRPVRMMHPRYPIYIVPKPGNQYVVGATEIESSDDKRPTLRSTMELLSAAYSVHKGFAEAELLSVQAGLRPALQDNEPAIFHDNRLFQANGLYRHGFMIAPYVLHQLQLLLGINSGFSSLVSKPDPRLIHKSNEYEPHH